MLSHRLSGLQSQTHVLLSMPCGCVMTAFVARYYLEASALGGKVFSVHLLPSHSILVGIIIIISLFTHCNKNNGTIKKTVNFTFQFNQMSFINSSMSLLV